MDAVIINDGNLAATSKCVESVLAQSAKPAKVFVVNNCSKNLFSAKNIVSINPGKNTGAAAGRNLAARQAKADFLLFVDNDAMLEKNCLRELLATINSAGNIAAVSAVIFGADERIWFSGGTINCFSLETRHLSERISRDRKTGYAPTTALLVKKSAFDSLHGFDEKLFVYFEDTDFCMRLGKHAKVFVSAKAKAWHEFSEKKNGKRVFFFARNRVLIARKRFGFARLLAFFVFIFTVDLFKRFFGLVLAKKAELFFAHLRGIIDGIKA